VATPPLIDRGSRHLGDTHPFYLPIAEVAVQMNLMSIKLPNFPLCCYQLKFFCFTASRTVDRLPTLAQIMARDGLRVMGYETKVSYETFWSSPATKRKVVAPDQLLWLMIIVRYRRPFRFAHSPD
jgi:hypothetical protein